MSIYERLYPWQRQVVDKFKVRHNFGLFLDMGLGKTPIALAFAEKNHCNKIIVVTLNSKALETQDDEGSWLFWAAKSNLNYEPISKKCKNPVTDRPQILLINYESLFSRSKSRRAKIELSNQVKEFAEYCRSENVALIIDESHKMKNLQSVQTQAINKLKRELKAKVNSLYTYLLTGTPFTKGYIDLYSQLKTLGYDETKGAFVDNFCIRGNIPGLLGWQQPIIGYKNVDALFRLVHQYAITINSEDVQDLPDKIFIEHRLKMSDEMKIFMQEKAKGSDILKFAKKRNCDINSTDFQPFAINEFSRNYSQTQQVNPFYRNIDFPSMNWLSESSGTFWMRARQLSIGFQGNAEQCEWYNTQRLAELELFLKNFEENYVLFYNFTPEMIAIYEICERLGYNVDVYCGEMKSLHFYNQYAKQSEAERLSNKKNIILANFASGSTGMNWQAYNNNIIFSLPVYKDWAQAIKRTHRTGQTKTVFYHVFSQNNWLDKGMRKALEDCTDYNSNMFESDLKRVTNIISEE